jgi:hypothetical protein
MHYPPLWGTIHGEWCIEREREKCCQHCFYNFIDSHHDSDIFYRFFTYNTLSKNEALKGWIPNQLLRNAGTGLLASIVSDTTVNAIRVVKTTKQSIGSKHNASYAETIRMILAADGWKGLFGRGLRTRIFANALQSMIFTVIWRGLADVIQRSKEDDDDDHAESDLAKEH